LGGERVERRLAAILAADVAGYSRLMGQDEAGTLQRLKALRGELVDPKIAEHKGRIVKTTGDGLLIEFPSVVEAVACAVAVQRDIAEQNASVPAAERLVFRVGINLGDVIIDGEDIHGDGVNIAARLEGLAEPGGICVSAVVYDQVRGRVDCPFEDLGEQTLKNISRPLRIYRVVRNSAARATGDVATKAAVHNNELPLPNKPSIAVLPFQNMSGDPEQEYFVDGMVEEIITALSRIRWLFVIARNSSFTYKGQSIDVKQVGRELGVRYVLEGSVRKSGERVRITAQLIDAETGAHLWAERYDQTLEDVFAVQEEVTRSIVAAVAPEVELAEIAHAGRFTANNAVAQLTWRAQGLFYEALQKGQPPLMTEAIGTAQRAIAIDAGWLAAYSVLGWAYSMCHLFRWRPEPEKALNAAWSAAERMLEIDALDDRTLGLSGFVRVRRGEQERAIADLRRAIEINPNSANALCLLAFAEAAVGLRQEAKEHGSLALRLSPRDFWITGNAQLALAMASYSAREYAEAVRWAELAMQSAPTGPIRRAVMIACLGHSGDQKRAAQERAVLDSFAPDFVRSLFRGENRVFARTDDMEHLLTGLKLAMSEPG